MEATQVAINKWMDNEVVVYIESGILLSHKKKNKILPLVTPWRDLEGIILSETSQTAKDKYHMIALIGRI